MILKHLRNPFFKIMSLFAFSFSMSLLITTPAELYSFVWTMLLIPLLLALFNKQYEFRYLFVATFISFATVIDSLFANVMFFNLYTFDWLRVFVSVFLIITHVTFFLIEVINRKYYVNENIDYNNDYEDEYYEGGYEEDYEEDYDE